MTPERIGFGILAVALIGALGFGAYGYREISRTLAGVQGALASSTEAYAQLEEAHASLIEERDRLADALASEEDKNDSYSGQVKILARKVDTLDKLANTDPELLKKYSKVYFLNENYAPASLSVMDPKYVYQEERALEAESHAARALASLIDDAEDDGVHLLLISGYRSFTTQASLKTSYRVRFGTGANAFSADQGYSEHQLGTAVDFTTKALGADFSNGFDQSMGYAWLAENAWRYGFILSYPESNGYYQYEPWHWRFVGKDLARALHEDGRRFYDLDQRDIDAYLVTLFD